MAPSSKRDTNLRIFFTAGTCPHLTSTLKTHREGYSSKKPIEAAEPPVNIMPVGKSSNTLPSPIILKKTTTTFHR